MSSKIFFKNELIHPFIQAFGCVIIFLGGNFLLNNIINENVIYFHKVLFWIFISIIIYLFIKISTQVRIEKANLVKGVYLEYIGLVFVKKSLSFSKITSVEAIQKEDKYFYIIAKAGNDELLILKEPNRLPAQKQLELII